MKCKKYVKRDKTRLKTEAKFVPLESSLVALTVHDEVSTAFRFGFNYISFFGCRMQVSLERTGLDSQFYRYH